MIAAASANALKVEPGHAAGHGPVDLGVEVVLAAVEAAQRAGARLDAGDPDVQLLVAEARRARCLEDALLARRPSPSW